MKKINLTLLVLTIVFVAIFSCKKESTTELVVNPPVILTDPSLVPFSAANSHLLDSTINNVLIGNQIPGIVVGIRSSTLGTYIKGFGVSNYATQSPMNTNAIFEIGSVHKNFKWVILHILEKEGRLDLDDLVNTYVSEPVLPGVTLRHLMQHSAGLCDIPDNATYNADAFNNPTFEFTYDTMMHYLNNSNGTSSKFGPFTNGRFSGFTIGLNSAYSSYGPLISCEVVKNITGKNMRQLINEKIIDPLGLTATSHTGYDPDPALLAPGHGNYVTVSLYTPNAASTMALSSSNGGGIQTDASDLLTYVHNQFTNPNFLPAQTISDLTQQNLQGFGMKSGLGVIQFDQWVPSNFWGHAGFGVRAHSTTMVHNKEHDLSIVVFANIYAVLDSGFQTNYAISEAVLNVLY